jgi:hypothetical protein
VGFESTIPVFDLAKRVHALDRAATVIDSLVTKRIEIFLTTKQYDDITYKDHPHEEYYLLGYNAA